MKRRYLMMGLLLVGVSSCAMDSTYRVQLETSFFEDFKNIPDKDGRNMNINSFISFIGNNTKGLDSRALKKILEKLSPEMYNKVAQLQATYGDNLTVDNQLCVVAEIMQCLSKELDTIQSDHEAQNKKQFEDIKLQKEKIVQCARCTSICSLFLFLWAFIATCRLVAI